MVVQVSCTEINMFEASKEFPDPNNLTITWRPPSVGTGVILDDETVLTAAHITTCPSIPTVHVYLSNGVRRRMSLVRENLSLDLALLRTYAAEPFHHGVAPPVLGVFEYLADGAVSCAVTAFPRRERRCGPAVSTTRFAFETVRGNSGSAVYDPAGNLVGIVTRSYIGTSPGTGAVFSHTRISEIPPGWLP